MDPKTKALVKDLVGAYANTVGVLAGRHGPALQLEIVRIADTDEWSKKAVLEAIRLAEGALEAREKFKAGGSALLMALDLSVATMESAKKFVADILPLAQSALSAKS